MLIFVVYNIVKGNMKFDFGKTSLINLEMKKKRQQDLHILIIVSQ